MTAFPVGLDDFSDHSAGDQMTGVPHATLHTGINDAVEAIEAKVGTGASTPTAGKVLTGTGAGASGWQDVPNPTGVSTVKDYGAVGDGVTDDRDAIIAAQVAGDVFFPEGTYLVTDWIPMLSNRRWYGVGPKSRIFNDLSNGDTQRHAVILPGNMHPGHYDSLTSYVLNAITAEDRAVTCTTAGDAANFSVDELVIVADTIVSTADVPRHAQLDKITGIAAGVVTLQDTIAESITSPVIWKLAGDDPSAAGTPIYAVENVVVENLALQGRNPLSAKGAVFHGVFRDLRLDGFSFVALNQMTHVIFERLTGTWTSRYMEFACNSYDVTARDWHGEWVAGDTQLTNPIHIGEQCWKILLEDIYCHAAYATATDWGQIKGRHVRIVNPDWVNESAPGGSSAVINVPDVPAAYAGYPFDDISIVGGRLYSDGSYVAAIGSAATIAVTTNPTRVRFSGTRIEGSPSSRAILWNNGTGHACGVDNRTTLYMGVSVACAMPDLTGYRGRTQP